MHPRRALTGLPWLALVASDQHRYWKRNKEHIAFDPSAFAKSGRESVGVARQWCGRLGGCPRKNRSSLSDHSCRAVALRR